MRWHSVGTHGRNARRGCVVAGLAAVLILAVGCGSAADDGEGAVASGDVPSQAPNATTSEYLPGLEADVYLPVGPSGEGGVPVVLLVPGGGWQTADRRGLAPLAEELAGAGFVVVNSTYRAGEDGQEFPVPLQDVICASGFAVDAARAAGLDGGPVVVLGHSAGGHLASLAALTGDELAGQCPYPVPAIDGLIGLAGVYDVRAFQFALDDFFGGTPAQTPDAWRQGDPVALLDSGRAPEDLEVLLMHGDGDDDIPLRQSRTFEEALTSAGVPVQLEVIPGATHQSIYTAEVAAPVAVDWIRDLAAGRSGG